MKNQAFTLIELLVVIAIIAILASLLLLALGKARRRTKRFASIIKSKLGLLGNCKRHQQRGGLVPALMSDWLTPPFPDRDSGSLISNMNWQDILCASYLDQNTDIFECPMGSRTVVKVLALARSSSTKYDLDDLAV